MYNTMGIESNQTPEHIDRNVEIRVFSLDVVSLFVQFIRRSLLNYLNASSSSVTSSLSQSTTGFLTSPKAVGAAGVIHATPTKVCCASLKATVPLQYTILIVFEESDPVTYNKNREPTYITFDVRSTLRPGNSALQQPYFRSHSTLLTYSADDDSLESPAPWYFLSTKALGQSASIMV